MLKLPLKYRILEFLITESDISDKKIIKGIDELVAEKFPKIPVDDIKSILADLLKDKLIEPVRYKDQLLIESTISPLARSVLVNVREQMQEKKESRTWQIKSMAIGYGLGVISTLVVTWLKSLIFG